MFKIFKEIVNNYYSETSSEEASPIVFTDEESANDYISINFPNSRKVIDYAGDDEVVNFTTYVVKPVNL